MDKHIKNSDRVKRVYEVMSELGLTKCADTVIGSPGKTKGISGGERKRLAFASEVIVKPNIII